MKFTDYILMIGVSLVVSGESLAQFQPPASSTATVMTDSNTNVLVAPTAAELISANPEFFPTANIRTLTRGTGLTGSNYMVTNATSWAIDQSWLVSNYHNPLSVQNGIQFTTSTGIIQNTNYTGQAERIIQIDMAYMLNWMNSLRRDFFLFVDMSPTPNDTGAYDTVSTSQLNPFYYRNVTAIRSTSTNAGTSGVTVPLVNATNVMHSTTATVPATYATSSFTVSTLSASLSGNITYDKATSLTNSFIPTTNPAGTPITWYATDDKVRALRYWTDSELKIIDKWGNIIYFTSTIMLNSSWVKQYHPEITDSNPTIYFFGTYNTINGCFGTKTKFTDFDRSIGYYVNQTSTGVSSIWIYPDFNSTTLCNGTARPRIPIYNGYNSISGYYPTTTQWGKYIREIVANPENTVIILRQTPTQTEQYNGNKFWRAIEPTYYGNWKESQ